MKVGSLVKYVGGATMYRDRIGIVATTYAYHPSAPHRHPHDSALVHFVGLEGKGRDEVVNVSAGRANIGKGDGLHPMAFDELEIVDESW